MATAAGRPTLGGSSGGIPSAHSFSTQKVQAGSSIGSPSPCTVNTGSVAQPEPATSSTAAATRHPMRRTFAGYARRVRLAYAS